jgi:uncharacterized protein YjbJ (UPF0337 family)
MNLNENTVKGKWLEIKGDIQKTWGKLTGDELDKTQGDMKSIRGLIQQKYGEAHGSYEKKLSDIFNRFAEKKDDAVDEIKKVLKQ